ncbi:phospholipase C/P1 nuclease domain-containing protein [Trametes gibbosa]|nr:phospholipase C/P1 nuclease domain-containing protein [Trametes gibbosa]
MRTSLSIAVVSVLASIPTVHAWGAAGHEIVATIAQIHLPRPVLSLVCDILHPNPTGSPHSSAEEAYPPCHLAPIAAWADSIRMRPEYRYTAPMHYVNAVDDAPPHSCPFPGAHGWQGRESGNILAALGNVTGVLREFARGERAVGDAEEALKFLVHWMGDMHQPLHMSGREKGGNGVRVAWNDRVTNLHSVWDGLLIAQALRLTPQNYSRALPGAEGQLVEPHLRGAIYDPYVRRIMHEGLSVGGRFDPESDGWLDCPAPPSPPPPHEDARTPGGATAGALGYALSLLGLGDSARVQALLALALDVPAALGLTTRAGAEEGWDDGAVCPYAWARAIHALNCDAELPVWPHGLDAPGDGALEGWREVPYDVVDFLDAGLLEEGEGAAAGAEERPRRHPELFELDTPEYAGRIARGWVVERLLATAGVRLAGVLTDVFADVAGEVY